MRQNWKRILAGLLVVFVIGQLAIYLLPVYESSESDSVADIESHIFRFVAIAYVWSFIAIAIGGFVARKKFLVPAVAYAAAEWAYGTVRGYMIAYNSWQEYDEFETWIDHGEILLSVALNALPQLLIVLALAALASTVGMRIFQAMKSRRVAA